jgi:DNA-binding NtrC family response regulator
LEIQFFVNKNGAIVIIEDDSDDKFVITEILKILGYRNKVLFFSTAEKALEYLIDSDTHPFLILSDIDRPKVNGLELRIKMQTNVRLSEKCVPYLFFTSSANKKSVIDAYRASVQGFFIKSPDFGELRNTLKVIIEYWKQCKAPSQLPNDD